MLEKTAAFQMPAFQRKVHLRAVDNFLRRGLDLCASALGLLFLAPLYAFIAVLIKSDSPGPVIYRGPRVGKGGREFHILKFRTMYETPESYHGPKVTAQGDARITPVGRWLRNTKLNELPQLWNVLKGEMSLVGPRPEDPEIVKSWPEEVRRELLSVRPGITSPASILYRDEETLIQPGNVVEDYMRSILPSKLRLDQLYVRNRNLINDLDVIFWTLVVLIPQTRREQIPEARLYWGPLSVFLANDFRWFLVDFFVALASVTAVGVVWRSITPLHIGWQYAPLIALAMAIVFSLSNALRGLNRVYWAKANPLDALDMLLSTVVATALLWMTNRFLITRPSVPLALFIFGGLVAYFGFVAVRYRERILTRMASRWLRWRQGKYILGERLLIVGAGELGQFAVWLVRKSRLAQAFVIVGIVDDDPRKQGLKIDGVKVLGSTETIQQLIHEQDVGLILFAISNIDSLEKERVLKICQGTAARIVMFPDVMHILEEHFRPARGNPGAAGRAEAARGDRARLTRWLDEIETLVRQGDLASLQSRIDALRAETRQHPRGEQ